MTGLARVVLDALRDDPATITEFRELLGISGPAADGDGWLGAAEAATFLGVSVNALHKLTARRALPFAQDVPGGKLYFRRRDLNAWREDRLHAPR